MKDIIIKKIDNIISKINGNLLHIPSCESGRYFDTDEGKYELNHILSTNQAYITGMALMAYNYTGESKYLDWCLGLYNEYMDKVDNRNYDTSQDVGILYWLYSVPIYNITGDERFRELSLKAADALSHRFIPHCGFIKAWGRADGNVPSYIDGKTAGHPFFSENMGLLLTETVINLPILAWAYWETRQYFYGTVADCHLGTMFKHLVRADGTTRHGFRFDGAPRYRYRIPYIEENYLGYSVDSYWARGAASAIYGLAHMQRYLDRNNPEKTMYLNYALRLINPFIDACAGELPVWDFASPDKTIDTASAAMLLCAIHEIQKYTDNTKINEFGKMLEEKLIAYIDTDFGKDGILREQSGKHLYDVSGDYFIAEAFLGTGDLW